MNRLFEEYDPYEPYKSILEEPLEADITTSDTFCHYRNVCIIKDNKIHNIDTNHKAYPNTVYTTIKNKTEHLYFLYVNDERGEWDDKYWFCVGKCRGPNGAVYFAYESGCCGTGFGLGSTSSVSASHSPELLATYGMTDKQRELITGNLAKKQRFPQS